LTGSEVKFESDLLISTVTYPLTKVNSRHVKHTYGENSGENGENIDEKNLIEQIKLNPNITQPQLSELLGFSLRKVNRMISALRKNGKIDRVGKTKGGYWIIH